MKKKECSFRADFPRELYTLEEARWSFNELFRGEIGEVEIIKTNYVARPNCIEIERFFRVEEGEKNGNKC